MSTLEESVDELVYELMFNHSMHKNKNIVFIIGAGVSNAVAGLPLGKELAADLIEKLDCKNGVNHIEFANHLDMMWTQYGFDRDDFKTILFSLNMLDSEKLSDHVEQSLGNFKINSFVYGLIANLLSDKYIDGIINFNFDELLDDELREVFVDDSNYLKVYSENTCPKNISTMINNCSRFEKPIYIKPHGTISKKNTLRFVRKDFYRIEPMQLNLIKKLLSQSPVILVVIGFRLKFLEFSRIIEESIAPGSEIYLINKEEDILDSCLLKYYNNKYIHVSDKMPLDQILKIISNKILDINVDSRLHNLLNKWGY